MYIKLFFLTLFTGFSLSGLAVNVSCDDPNYAGKELIFYQFTDPVSKEISEVFTLKFDATGKATTTVNTTGTLYTFSEFGIYKGLLFLRPGQNIIIKLPAPKEKSFADQKNPYFSPISFWINTENKNDLSSKTASFTQEYNLLSDRYFNELFFRRSKSIYDTVSQSLSIKFDDQVDKAFVMHKNLSLRMLEAEAFRMKPESYSDIFNTIGPEFWVHPSFINLFEKTFSHQLSFSAKAINGDEIRNAVNTGKVSILLDHVKSKYNLNGKMAELALLKMLYDAFFSGDFAKNTVKRIVNNQLYTQNSNLLIKTAAKRISDKFDFLQTGSTAPVICLPNINDKEVCSDQSKDKFKYLVFADNEMLVSKEQVKYLKNIDQRFRQNLEIIIVFRNSDLNEIKTFVRENEIPGEKLIDRNNTYTEAYKIKTYPQSFLLDEQHRVALANTKSPLDGFEQQFGTYIRSVLFERQRNQSR